MEREGGGEEEHNISLMSKCEEAARAYVMGRNVGPATPTSTLVLSPSFPPSPAVFFFLAFFIFFSLFYSASSLSFYFSSSSLSFFLVFFFFLHYCFSFSFIPPPFVPFPLALPPSLLFLIPFLPFVPFFNPFFSC